MSTMHPDPLLESLKLAAVRLHENRPAPNTIGLAVTNYEVHKELLEVTALEYATALEAQRGRPTTRAERAELDALEQVVDSVVHKLFSLHSFTQEERDWIVYSLGETWRARAQSLLNGSST